jgi:TolB-like protein/Tfp pilus assembly protein PilF
MAEPTFNGQEFSERLISIVESNLTNDQFGVTPENEPLEKTIAVLPFKNDSPDSTNAYFINGLMESILNNLSNIEDLSVRSRTSVEKYRTTSKSLKEIAKELDVNYLVEGNGRKYGDEILLNIQLLEANTDRHLFSEQYRKEIREVKDFIDLQSEIALNIVSKIEAEITPDEKKEIEKTPTSSLTAHNFFTRGREEIIKFYLNNRNTIALLNAEKYYRESLAYDSSYAQAYAGMAEVYKIKNKGSELFSDSFLDSMLYFADKAISFDKKSSEAYAVRGLYYWYQGNRGKALEEYNTALKYNPDLWYAYRGKGTLFIDSDPARSIKNFHKAASLVHGDILKIIMDELITAYLWAGFVEKALKYNNELLLLFGDSLLYHSNLGAIESQQGNVEKAVKYYEKAYAIDTSFTSLIWFNKDILRQLSFNYMLAGHYEKSLKYIKKWVAMLNVAGEKSYNGTHRVGYVLWKTGNRGKASHYFELQMKYCNELIRTNHVWAQNYFAYYDRAGINAFRGDKEEAFKDLRIFNQIVQVPLWMVTLIKTDPLFENLREEPEFKQIVKDVESKYESEHKRIGRSLREMGYD